MKITNMKTIWCRFVLAGMLLWSASAQSEGWVLEQSVPAWESFTLGVASGIVLHEAGHLLVAKTKGYKVSHDRLSITYPGTHFTRSGQLQLASAGFQTQWVLSELVLRDRDGSEHTKPPSDFDAGVVVSYLGVSAAYLTFLKNQYNGDVYGMSRASGYSHDRIALMMAVPAVLDAWRLFGNDVPQWVPALSVASKGIGAAWIWTY